MRRSIGLHCWRWRVRSSQGTRVMDSWWRKHRGRAPIDQKHTTLSARKKLEAEPAQAEGIDLEDGRFAMSRPNASAVAATSTDREPAAASVVSPFSKIGLPRNRVSAVVIEHGGALVATGPSSMQTECPCAHAFAKPSADETTKLKNLFLSLVSDRPARRIIPAKPRAPRCPSGRGFRQC